MLSYEEYLKLPLEERYIKLDASEKDRAEKLFEESIAVDLHTHIFGSVHFEWDNHLYERVRNSGINVCFEAVPCLSERFSESVEQLGRYLAITVKEPGLTPAYNLNDVKKAKKEGKQAVMFQMEPQSFRRNLDLVDVAYGLGFRMALLTFNTRNYIGDGCSERTNSGLSYMGLELVDRLNRAGMMITLSHCGTQTALDAIEHSKDPCLFNHTGARALNPKVGRLRTDEELKAIAEKGGVVGISAIPNQLSLEKKQGIEDHLNHIDYIVNLIGINHVGIGLDNTFHDQVGFHRKLAASKEINLERTGIVLAADYMWGLESPEEWPNIIRGLVKRGYSDTEIEKIIGGNALRIIEKVIG
ncbi:MAG: dipeptidase [Candidatus Heimdallarchaeota archaeon]